MVLLNVVLPIFLIIGSGYFLRHYNVFDNQVSLNLGKYLQYAATPAIILSCVDGINIHQILIIKFIFVYLLSICITLFITYCLLKIFIKNRMVCIINAFSAITKNTVIMGMPVLINISGNKIISYVIATIIIYNCLVAPLLIFVCEIGSTKNESRVLINHIYTTIKNTFKNPVVLSAFMALSFSIFHIVFPVIISHSLKLIGNSFIPCALFAVGIELKLFKLEGNVAKILIISISNLIICPVIGVLLGRYYQLSNIDLISLFILLSMPTAKSMFVYLSKYDNYNKDVAAIISATTLFSLITMPGNIYIINFLR